MHSSVAAAITACARARLKMIITATFPVSLNEPRRSLHSQFYKMIGLRGQLQSSEAFALSYPPHIANALLHLSVNTKVK